MSLIFYIISFLTIFFTVLSVIEKKIMYSLFYFFVSVLTTSGIFFLLGDYMIGSLQIIIYSGAILVLFVFVVMLLNYDEIKNNFFLKRYNYFYLVLLLSFIVCFYKIFFYLHNKYVFRIVNNLHILGKVLFEPYILFIEFMSVLLLSIVIVIMLIVKNSK